MHMRFNPLVQFTFDHVFPPCECMLVPVLGVSPFP